MNQLDLALDEVFNPTHKQENHMHGTINKKKRVASTFKERLAIHNLLDTHLHKDGELWTYDEGWSDQRVAKEAGERLNIDHVKTVRIEMFGPLRNYGNKTNHPKTTGLVKRVDELETIVLKLVEKVGL